MPVMDGLEATRRIRASAGGKSVIILALTAHAMEKKAAEALDTGVNDFLSKPCNETEVLQRIQVHLGVTYSHVESSPTQCDAVSEGPGEAESHILWPPELIADLLLAVEKGEKRKLNQLIEQAAQLDPRAAPQLKRCSNNYEYDTLTTMLQGFSRSTGSKLASTSSS